MKKATTRLILGLLVCVTNGVLAMNIIRPYNPFVRAERQEDYRAQIALRGQASFGCAKGYDEQGCSVNVLRIWNPDQNALKMLCGFEEASDIGQLKSRLIDANDDGVRGHFLVDGELDAYGFALSGRWSLPENISLVAHIPFQFMRLKGVRWMEQTQSLRPEDTLVKDNLTNDFFNNVCTLGDGLCLGSWSRSGLGDCAFLVEWQRDFVQAKQLLKNVRLNTRAGVLVPSGRSSDEDKIFALPFGTDGGVGILFGAGLDLTLGSYIKAGLDVELTHVFNSRRCRRIKTHEEQTELLLLAKTDTLREFGLTQQFSLYLQGYRFWSGLSAFAGYQFCRHGEDRLSLFEHDYSESIANTANSLEEWTMHNFFFSLSYDFLREDDDARFHPYLSAFIKIPFNGKFSAQTNLIGLVLSFDF